MHIETVSEHTSRTTILYALALSTAYFAVACIGIYLTREGAHAAAIWPANGLLLGALLRSHPRHYVAFIVGCFFAGFSANSSFGDAPILATGFAVCNTMETLVAFALLRRIMPSGWRHFTTRHVLVFVVVAGLVAPLVAAIPGSYMLHLAYGVDIYTEAKNWWRADAMGLILVTPAVLSWNAASFGSENPKLHYDTLKIGTATITATLLAFSQQHLALIYIVTPALLWAAFKLDTFRTATAALIVWVIAVSATLHGMGPIANMAANSVLPSVELLQLFLGVSVLVPLIVAMLTEERQRLVEELESKNAELERYTYTVSHDLKAPLVTLKGFLGHLRSDLTSGSSADIEEDLAELEKATNTMHQLLQDLLELSQQGVVADKTQNFCFHQLVNELVAESRDRNAITIDTATSLPLAIGDRDRLAVVLRNLLDNAQKFSSRERRTHIRIATTTAGGKIECRISDNGIGIPPEHLYNVFELFERLDTNIAGTGVGLAIVKSIVEAHGGKIWAESEGWNKGATFVFVIPALHPTLSVLPRNVGGSGALHIAD